MAYSTPPGRWDSVYRRAERPGRAGWLRVGVVIAVVGASVIGTFGRSANLWVVYGEAGH
jgi:hypothetical protein